MYNENGDCEIHTLPFVIFKQLFIFKISSIHLRQEVIRIIMAQKKKGSPSPKGFSHPDYDSAVLNCFLEKQLQLFPEEVASTPEEAADFLEMCFAVVAKSKKEVRTYFEEVGTDIEGEDIFSAAEVFPVGDGRYLIVEG